MFNRYAIGRVLGALATVAGLLALAAGLDGLGLALVAVGAAAYAGAAYPHSVHRDAIASLGREQSRGTVTAGASARSEAADLQARLLNEEQAASAGVERATHFAGTGALIQALGLLAPFVGYYLFGTEGAAIGIGALVVLFVIGSVKAISWRCGSCKNPLAHQDVRLCPVCHTRLHR